ncbi:integral membrane protein [Mycobacterium marinum]|uniref:hypothetical protein n=1 Tax=Mycobacterium marinum TaxID=1781 RepID=UPI000E3BE1A6|nr:hypothetical protein [Mycobacterium marinum]RFZ41533.1 hypothetical protein KST_01700 [Mycobacterium marinum]GJN98210.1 integral membrane protein [Mycobacterium marinum]GJO01712.1 integral membrane protein [Mycobacterium marinum]GJO17230.1 integral membrane protein [Mycobacterium marinum]GJO26962.1 integral membrane protein [Mycobacterium marinum]
MGSVAGTGSRVLSPVFGLLMVGAAGAGAHGPVIVALAGAVIALVAGILVRAAATVAVLLTVLALVLSAPSQLLAALCGLCAVAYLVSRHAARAPAGVAMATWPTIVAALGFAFAGLAATAFPLQVPWLPLAAPLAVLAIYVLATRPFLH